MLTLPFAAMLLFSVAVFRTDVVLQRKLRIAFSTFCALIALSFVTVSVRSYWWTEEVFWKISDDYAVGIWNGAGHVVFSWHSPRNGMHPGARSGIMGPRRITDRRKLLERTEVPSVAGFGADRRFDVDLVMMPHWCLVLLTGAIAALPWMSWQWRFSLRTLLVAMTLVALSLGLFVLSR
jgi:hypothetical protein